MEPSLAEMKDTIFHKNREIRKLKGMLAICKSSQTEAERALRRILIQAREHSKLGWSISQEDVADSAAEGIAALIGAHDNCVDLGMEDEPPPEFVASHVAMQTIDDMR